ncbi:hypothetical protein [Pelovirga terrestris]|uniref:Uncharacterized protein n=1 Tax=Pelovirga terrestris TaxID=2771352 RepID=A0A8J6UNF4_9BACT|nr:hypothetical protein [Pelovirga terrestris]MBD1399434.1 hypothetical protein [Pelovirga terrestris]
MKKGWMHITTKALVGARAFSPYITKTTEHNSTENPTKQQGFCEPDPAQVVELERYRNRLLTCRELSRKDSSALDCVDYLLDLVYRRPS